MKRVTARLSPEGTMEPFRFLQPAGINLFIGASRIQGVKLRPF
ncbi:hypothetical protein [Bacillus salacetis]|nr:hypothetical protein [Bacillus salacetis]